MSNEIEENALIVRLTNYAQGRGKLNWGDEQLAADIISGLRIKVNHARAILPKAWWRGVEDQWKHIPQGNRILESKNPYRVDVR